MEGQLNSLLTWTTSNKFGNRGLSQLNFRMSRFGDSLG